MTRFPEEAGTTTSEELPPLRVSVVRVSPALGDWCPLVKDCYGVWLGLGDMLWMVGRVCWRKGDSPFLP